MRDYFVNNNLIKGAYVVHYNEEKKIGWVEKVDTCSVPERQSELYPGLIAAIGLDHYYILDALVAAWYSKRVTCEFTNEEFEEFCKSYPILNVFDDKLGVLGCQFGFQGNEGYMRIQFSDKVGDLEKKLDEYIYEDNVLSIIFPLWDDIFKQIPQVETSEHVGPPGGLPTVNNSCHVATYRLEKI